VTRAADTLAQRNSELPLMPRAERVARTVLILCPGNLSWSLEPRRDLRENRARVSVSENGNRADSREGLIAIAWSRERGKVLDILLRHFSPYLSVSSIRRRD